MKKSKLLALAALALGVSGSVYAQSDITSTYLTNANFEDTYTVFKNPKSDRAIYQPKGWNIEYKNGETNDMTALKSSDLAASTFAGKLGSISEGGEQTYKIRFRWGNSESLTLSQDVTLPVGEYILSAEVAKNNSSATAVLSVGNNTKAIANNTEWTVQTVEFTLTEEKTVTIAFTYTQTAAVESVVGIDNVKLYKKGGTLDVTPLTSEITTAEKLLASYKNDTEWYNSLNTAITNAKNANPKDLESLNQAINTLKQAESDAKAAEFKSHYAQIEDGAYYLYNVEAKRYLSNGGSWGTQAVLYGTGLEYNVSKGTDGLYTLKSGVKGSSTSLRPSDGYNDQSGAWVVLKTAKDGEYYLYNGSKYYSSGETNLPVYLDEPTEASVWKFVTKSERTGNGDYTPYVKCADFLPNFDSTSSWDGAPGMGGANNTIANTYNAQKWNAGNFDINQTVSDLPNGHYKVTVQGFYRHGNADASSADAYEGNTETLPAFYAGGSSINLKSIYSEAKESSATGWGNEIKSTNGTTYFICNTQAEASYCFEAGAYVNTLNDVKVTNGTLKIGIKREGDQNYDWTVFDSFTLTYLSPLTVDEVKESISGDIASANAIDQNSPMNKTALKNLQDALDAADAITGSTSNSEIATIKTDLINSTSAANTSIQNYTEAKTYLDKANTSGLDATAQKSYANDETVKAVKSAYDERTFTALTDKQKTAMDAALIAAVKAQTSENAVMTPLITNAAVADGTGWESYRGNSGEQYDGAPDNTYMDQWSGAAHTRDINQTISLKAGVYTLKAATRAQAGITAEGVEHYIYAKVGEKTTKSDPVNAVGADVNAGDLGRGWNWSTVQFNVPEDGDVTIGFYTSVNNSWSGADDFSLVRNGDYVAPTPATSELKVADGTPITTAATGVKVTYTRNFANTEWQGLYVPYAVTASAASTAGVTLAQITGTTVNNGTVTFEIEKVTTATGPNKPLLVKAAATGEKTISMEDVTIATPDESEQSIGDATFRGVVTAEWAGFGGSDYYALAGGQLCKGTSGVKLPINRWGVKFSSALVSGSKLRINFSGDFSSEDATGIAETIANTIGAKSYSINGVEVNADAKGLIIKNGKKIMVK